MVCPECASPPFPPPSLATLCQVCRQRAGEHQYRHPHYCPTRDGWATILTFRPLTTPLDESFED